MNTKFKFASLIASGLILAATSSISMAAGCVGPTQNGCGTAEQSSEDTPSVVTPNPISIPPNTLAPQVGVVGPVQNPNTTGAVQGPVNSSGSASKSPSGPLIGAFAPQPSSKTLTVLKSPVQPRTLVGSPKSKKKATKKTVKRTLKAKKRAKANRISLRAKKRAQARKVVKIHAVSQKRVKSTNFVSAKVMKRSRSIRADGGGDNAE